MSNDLTTSSTDGWSILPQGGASSFIRGSLVTFKTGEFFQNKQLFKSNASYAVTGVIAAWICWKEGSPQDVRLAQGGQPYPQRGDLPDQDEELWEKDRNGNPTDPWNDSRYVYLVDRKTGEELTFTTHSMGGRKAVSDLGQQVAKVRTAHPNASPIIQLSTTKWPTAYGLQYRPLLEVVDWVGGNEPEAKSLSASDLIDDLIPF